MIKKILYRFLPVFILMSAAYFLSLRSKTSSVDFDYFFIDCAIYNKDKKVIFHAAGYYCDYLPDGKLLRSRHKDGILHLEDKNQNVLWSSLENIHHDMKFTTDQKAFLAITTEVFKYEDVNVRGDCFSKRDLNNKILYRWCLSENIDKLKELGFTFKPVEMNKKHMPHLTQIDFEVSHANSIFEIPKNPLASSNPAFAEGNFLINLFFPSYALLILDHEMKSVLWHYNLSRFQNGNQTIEIKNHDNQLTPDGRILTYVNSYNTPTMEHFSSALISWNPITKDVKWIYQADPPESFFSKHKGTISPLRSGDYLLTDITDGDRVFAVTQQGKVIWDFKMPATSREIFGTIRKVAPLYDTGFLKSRGLIN